jgi:hypothetical protein
MNTNDLDPNIIIDALGGTGSVAELCEVTPGGVSQWRTDGIPRARLLYLKAKRPKVFKTLLNAETQIDGND